MTPVADFIRHVAPVVPGCPDPMIEAAIVSALISFCEQSSVWHEVSDVFLLGGIQCYDLPIPRGARIHCLLSGQNSEGQPIEEKTVGWFNLHVPNWSSEQGDPVKYVAFGALEGTAIVVPVPTKTNIRGVMTLDIVLKPERDAEEVPEMFYQDYLDGVVMLAKAHLMREPGKTWSSPQAANDYLALAAEEIRKASIRATPGLTGRATSFGMKAGAYT